MVATLAEKQHGVVAHRQLLGLGLGPRAIQYGAENGRLHRIHRGVYAVGHPAIGFHGRLMAAVLACGAGALLSHRSAAWMWGLRRASGSGIDVTGPRCRGRKGIAVHRARNLRDDDRSVVEAIPVTSVARTLLDLAEVARPRELERAVEEAERLRLFDLGAVEELSARSRGRRGLRRLRALLADVDVTPPPTRSELERGFFELCRKAGLPVPSTNIFLAGFEVDAAWPEQWLVVELDGYAFHGSRAAFERDRLRDAALQAAGYRVVRVTHRRLRTERAAVTETLRSMLAAGGPRAGPPSDPPSAGRSAQPTALPMPSGSREPSSLRLRKYRR
jgi:predicted transcriptional regulator of viral defense system